MGYCSNADVSLRLGLDSGQRDRAASRITSALRRSAIEIDQTFRDYGREAPSSNTASTTANGAISTGDTTITLTSATSFSTAGTGNVDGDTFKWTGKSGSDLTGVTGIDYAHATGVTIQEGEFAHVMREICADMGAAFYLEDDAAFHANGSDSVRSNVLRVRAMGNLIRLAHLGTVD